ncbi:MAG: sodium:solute symporter [Prevotella sp.]|nr:sodium:solute symporter [Prevotella sp.]
MMILITILVYFALLMLFSRLTSRRSDNDTFYRGNRQSPWYMVAFGMVGASISGVTFVSVPGMVLHSDMTYMQTCLGFILGYVAVAFILLPVYYRMNLTTIYTYLYNRLGERSYKTGAWFFLLSKMTGAAARFYVVCIILQRFVLDALGVPFALTVVCMVALIWLYTRRGGIKTLVWTDTLQTTCMFTALLLIIWQVTKALGMSPSEAVTAIMTDSHSRVFVFDDWVSRQNFWKQFLSGIFIVIVMTGLDQDMMQKNLTCKSLREAQKDMCSYGVAFVPANLLFLSLGVLLTLLAARQGTALPQAGDELLPMFAATGALGNWVLVLFSLGIVAASFSSADSALTAMTTSFCVDICRRKGDEQLRKRAHVGMAVVFAAFILLFRLLNSPSIIDAIYVMCSYTYGPLLGLFAYGLLTRQKTNDRYVPYIAVASPLICFALDWYTSRYVGYKFGYELLMLNGLITFAGIALLPKLPCSRWQQP